MEVGLKKPTERRKWTIYLCRSKNIDHEGVIEIGSVPKSVGAATIHVEHERFDFEHDPVRVGGRIGREKTDRDKG